MRGGGGGREEGKAGRGNESEDRIYAKKRRPKGGNRETRGEGK